MRAVGRILIGVYNIITTYLLGWVLFFAVVAFGLHLGEDFIIAQLGFERTAVWWRFAAAKTGISSVYLRLVIFVALHALILVAFRGVIGPLQQFLEKTFDALHRRFKTVTDDHPTVAASGRFVFTVVVTLVLIPFVLQPTLVRGWTTPQSWVVRTANLADGTASNFVIDSVIGAYRRYWVQDIDSFGGVSPDVFGDVDGGGLDSDDFGNVDRPDPDSPDDERPDPDDPAPDPPETPPAPTGSQPMMDRWDPVIRRVTNGKPREFAYVKAFMWVESAGRQFAVSHTGCAGLMQFCSGTARSEPFRSVFGAGAVYACGCGPNCSTPRSVIRALETGQRDQVSRLDQKFPCELTDARFDGEKALEAGKLYIDRLSRDFGDNIYLMYVGYNSGPAVAKRVWRKVGRDPSASLSEIETHLSTAMEPYFPNSSSARARSLVQTHLPKLKRAYDRYRADQRRAQKTRVFLRALGVLRGPGFSRVFLRGQTGSASASGAPSSGSGSFGSKSKLMSSSSSST